MHAWQGRGHVVAIPEYEGTAGAAALPPVVSQHLGRKLLYFRPPVFCCDLITFLTIFASSTRNARRMLYARDYKGMLREK